MSLRWTGRRCWSRRPPSPSSPGRYGGGHCPSHRPHGPGLRRLPYRRRRAPHSCSRRPGRGAGGHPGADRAVGGAAESTHANWGAAIIQRDEPAAFGAVVGPDDLPEVGHADVVATGKRDAALGVSLGPLACMGFHRARSAGLLRSHQLRQHSRLAFRLWCRLTFSCCTDAVPCRHPLLRPVRIPPQVCQWSVREGVDHDCHRGCVPDLRQAACSRATPARCQRCREHVAWALRESALGGPVVGVRVDTHRSRGHGWKRDDDAGGHRTRLEQRSSVVGLVAVVDLATVEELPQEHRLSGGAVPHEQLSRYLLCS